MNAMKSIVMGSLCFAALGAARAATCTFDGGWDVEPSGASDEIVIASGSLTWDDTLPAKVASWSQTGGTVTFKKAFDAPLEVTGAVTLSGGTWTHAANGSAMLGSTANKYRVYVKCGGGMTIGADALITGEGLGYRSHQSLPGKTESGTQGGSYGGHGGMATATFNSTYGSLFAPEELGNEGGNWNNTFGGGCVRLDVGGKLTLQGAVNVNGQCTNNQKYYSGAGGSIFIHADSIEGAGTLSANSGVSSIGGGGGRIAVILTGAESDFSNYDIFNLANAHSGKAEARQGGCGTIYAETVADGANHGWLILKGNGCDPSGADTNSEWYYADPFSVDLTSANFSKITIAGKTKFYIREGYTLDMAGTVLDCRVAGYGLRVKGGTLMVKDGGPMTLTGTLELPAEYSLTTSSLTIGDGGTLSIHEKLTVSGNVVVAGGGKITTAGASSNPCKAHLAVGGNLTVDAGGTIDVTGRGYSINTYPGGKMDDSSGGSHGGWGLKASGAVENCASPYGSVVDPVTAGSGGGQSSSANSDTGGGVVILDVAGALTVNGSILANGKDKNHYAGAGGSINITAASIAGGADAVITANAGLASNATSASGGGRIAIKLTGVGQDFDGYLGTLTAYGYRKAVAAKSDTDKRGGAGTVYLQTAAQGENGGTLIVDNGEASSSGKTLLGGTATGTTFGDIIIRGKAQLVLADGETLTVKGDFSNQATFAAGAGSTVVFAGTGVSTVLGNTTFANLACTTPGKEIRFAAGSTQKVKETLNVVSDGDKIRLVSTQAGSAWTIDTTGASADISGVAIGDCQSVVPITAKESESLGGNSDNVTVIGKIEAKTFTWTGNAGDGAWGTVGNWDDGERAPLDKDTVIVPAETETMPTIGADTTVAALTVAGSLDFGAKTLTVTGPLTVTGELLVQRGAKLLVGGDMALATVSPRTLALVLNGTASQSAVFASSLLLSVEAVNPSVSFAGDFFCETLTLGNATDTCDYAFADGTSVEAILAYVNGSLSQPNVTLRPAEAGKTWTFTTKASSVVGAIVSGSDARGGAAVIPQASTDATGNFNWNFADTRLRWNGLAGNGDFADAGNWAGGQAPTKDDSVVIEGDFTVKIAAETEVAGLSVGLKAKVTVNAPLTVGGSVSVTPFGTLVANKPISVGGDFDVLDWATLTHNANSKTVTNKIDIAVAGNGAFAEQATVDVAGKGYTRYGGYAGKGCSSSGDPPYAASYGGRGYYGAQASYACYGSIANPTDVGSAGGWDGDGGGAIILSFGGSLSIDCTFCANGGKATRDGQYRNYYGSSGGSINLMAATLSGKGALQANGGWINGGNRAGGGGRIAVRLTDPAATFEGCGITMETFGGPSTVKPAGSAGTIFTKTAAEECGTLKIAKSANATYDAAQERTDFPKTQDNDPNEVKNVAVRLGTKATLNLTADATVSSLTFDSNDARILLNGHKLYILGTAKKSVKDFVRSRATPGADADGNPGEIIWLSGFTLFVR